MLAELRAGLVRDIADADADDRDGARTAAMSRWSARVGCGPGSGGSGRAS
jgi:hypothetical protein